MSTRGPSHSAIGAGRPERASRGATKGATLHIEALPGFPEVQQGDDLPALVAARVDLADGDVVVVAQKIVSKAEGAVVWPRPDESRQDARARVAREEAVRTVATAEHVAIFETRHGFVCANAGVDTSNVAGEGLTLLPADPDASAQRLRAGLWRTARADVAVIVSDSFGRPWRRGQTDVALGCAGLTPLRDERGTTDRHGHVLGVTQGAVADELAGAADLVRGKADGVPVVVIRGHRAPSRPGAGGPSDPGTDGRALLRPAAQDLFPRGRGAVTDLLAGGTPEPLPRPYRSRPDATGPRPGDRVAKDDLDRAVAAGEQAGHGLVKVHPLGEDGVRLAVVPRASDALVAAGACAGALMAALVDLGHRASHRPPLSEEPGAVVVVVEAAL